MSETYVWLVWSVAFLVPWVILFVVFPGYRKAMMWASLFTAPFGLTEPLFVPEYWSPPSLFDLARQTGFDIESLIFSFGIGGVGAVLFKAMTRRRSLVLPDAEHHHHRHRFHLVALVSPFIVFLLLYWFPWNPIYPSIVSMALGALATVLCRPDLKVASAVGAIAFLAYYLVFLVALELSAPGYIEKFWNLSALSGWMVFSIPVEELMFATAFGAYWAGVYEHFTWRSMESGVELSASAPE